MRFVVLGTSEFTLCCARALMDSECEVAALISVPQEQLPLNSVDIAGFAKEHNIAYFETEDINAEESIHFMKEQSPDYIFSSWPKILDQEVLDIPKKFVIGSHPTALPFNRGRHPLHWLMALGIDETRLSFFIMDQGVDTGKILLQVPFQIKENDKIGDVVLTMNKAAYDGTKQLGEGLRNDSLEEHAQDHKIANVWRKRTAHDVTLDMRMSTEAIVRTVRSFAPPYPGANLIFEDHIIKIVNAEGVEESMPLEQTRRIEQGRILGIQGNRIRIKADDGIVDLECKEAIPEVLLKAKYIHPPTRYISEFSVNLMDRKCELGSKY